MAPHSSELPELRCGLHSWFGTTPGRLLLDLEIGLIGQRLPSMFGYYLVQVGELSATDMLSGSLIRDRSIVDIDGTLSDSEYPRLRGSADALPIASDSVDVVLLPHVLEFEPRPHDALREAQRVLVPEGNLLISGFNPWSLMGVWRSALKRRGVAPWCGNFLGLNRVSDWLALLGFDIVEVQCFFFRPPLRNLRLLERLSRLERLGRRAGGVFAGAYLISARKRVSTLTPIRPRWSTRPRLAPVGLANPTARTSGAGMRRARAELTLVHVSDHAVAAGPGGRSRK